MMNSYMPPSLPQATTKLEPITLSNPYPEQDPRIVALEKRLAYLDDAWTEALETKNQWSLMIGRGQLPNADFVYELLSGVDMVINKIVSERTILRWNHGDIEGPIPQERNGIYPDPQLRELCLKDRAQRDEWDKNNHLIVPQL